MEFKGRRLISLLYEAFRNIWKDKRVIKAIIAGVTIYGTPAAYRYVTRNPILPYVPLVESPNPYIPCNLPEKLVVNAVAPGGVGAVMGESFFSSAWREKIKGLKKYFSRVTGSFVATSAWTAVQYVGHRVCETLKYEWPSGGNPFEPPTVYPFNLVMALSLALAPLTPYLVECLSLYLRRKRSHNPNKAKNDATIQTGEWGGIATG